MSSYLDIINGANDVSKSVPSALSRNAYKYCLSLGNPFLDLITGGGAARGRIFDIFGWEASGKTTTMYYSIADAQRRNVPIIAVFDHEASLDPDYAQALGCDMSKVVTIGKNGKVSSFDPGTVLVFQNDVGEQTYRWINSVLSSLPTPEPGDETIQAAFFIDSVKAMLAEAYQQNPENKQRGREAAMHSHWLPFIKPALSRKNASLFVTNQMRVDPGTMFGRPDREAAASAWKYYPDQKMEIRGKGKVWEEHGTECRISSVKTHKNKIFRPYQAGEVTLGFGFGFLRPHAIKDYLYRTGQLFSVLNKNGNKTKTNMIVWRDDFGGIHDHERGEFFVKSTGGAPGIWSEINRHLPDIWERVQIQLRQGVAYEMYLEPAEGSCKGCFHFTACRKKGARVSELEPRCEHYITVEEAEAAALQAATTDRSIEDLRAEAQRLQEAHTAAVDASDTDSVLKIEQELDAIMLELDASNELLGA